MENSIHAGLPNDVFMALRSARSSICNPVCHGAKLRGMVGSMAVSLLMLLALNSGAAHAVSVDAHPNLQKVVDELVAENVYTRTELVDVLARATIQEKILEAMKNPAESKFTWGKYRKLFMKPDRIEAGAQFWREHHQELSRAEQKYGVPAEMIVAIIGVESKFGRFKGSHKVIDSLVSLVVDFPRRSAFFASELKHFLILVKENSFAIDEVMGSYAGAMGYPQFIASSYRHYAVDFSADGVTDLINQPSDAIGSIANYFVENGWKRDEPVTSEGFSSVPAAIVDLANRKREVRYTAQELRRSGAPVSELVADNEKLNVLWLNAAEEVNNPQQSGLYTVRAGDTVCEIAESQKVSCRALMALNKIDSRGKIYRGQQLKLPVSARSTKLVEGRSDSKWKVNSKSLQKNDSSTIDQYFFPHENFYVITRYNQSVLYAMAVFELSKAIKMEHQKVQSATGGY